MKIDLKKKYQTRDGRPVRVLAVDLPGPEPVVAAIIEPGGGRPEVYTFFADGSFLDDEDESDQDLVEVPEVIEVTRYASMYQHDDGVVKFATFPTIESARTDQTYWERPLGVQPVTIKVTIPPSEEPNGRVSC